MRFLSNDRNGKSVTILTMPPAAVPDLERRRAQRFKTAQLVELCIQNLTMAAELVDLSTGGAKLRISAGRGAKIGSWVAIRLLDQTVFLGVTRWKDVENIGMQFLNATMQVEDYLHYDDRGEQMFSLILSQQRRLRRQNELFYSGRP